MEAPSFLKITSRTRRKTFALRDLEDSNAGTYEEALNESRQKRLQSEEEEIEKQLKGWLVKMIKEDPARIPNFESMTLHEYLVDGSRLCMLLNSIYPGAIKKFYVPQNLRRIIPYRRLDNINQFLETCARLDILPEIEHFLTVDLFEQKNMKKVRSLLMAMQRLHPDPSSFAGSQIMRNESASAITLGQRRTQTPKIPEPKKDSKESPRSALIPPLSFNQAPTLSSPLTSPTSSEKSIFRPASPRTEQPPSLSSPRFSSMQRQPEGEQADKTQVSPRSNPPTQAKQPVSEEPQSKSKTEEVENDSKVLESPKRANITLPKADLSRGRTTTSVAKPAASEIFQQDLSTEIKQLQTKLQTMQQSQEAHQTKVQEKHQVDTKIRKTNNLLKQENERLSQLVTEKEALIQVVREFEDKKKRVQEQVEEQKKRVKEETVKEVEETREKHEKKDIRGGGGGQVPPGKLIRWIDLKIKKRVGGGGFAEIFQADLHGEMVAVKKFLDNPPAAPAKKELEKEIAANTMLSSSSVVQVIGYCMEPPSMVMEFYPRGSLSFNLWNGEVKIPWKRRWKIAYDMSVAINHMHTRKPPMYHRDLKAANFLVRQDWKVQLCDFGTAVFWLDKEKNPEGVPVEFAGTLNWTAPEILDGAPYSDKADVYSFAMVLFELATRKEPWHDHSSMMQQLNLRKMIGEGQRPPIPSDVPENFKKLMDLCWKQNKVERLTMQEVVEKVRSYMAAMELEEDDEDEEMTEAGIEDQLESLQQEIEVQKMLCGMARERGDSAEAALESEMAKSSENRRKLVDAEIKLEMLTSELENMKRDVEKLKENDRKLTSKANELDNTLSDNNRKIKRLEKTVERYKKREEEDNETK